MLRGTQSNSVPSKWNDLLQSSQGKPLKLEVAYPSFHVPDYTKHVHSLVGRLWAYDNVSGMLVLETGQAPPLPTALRNSPVSAVYEAGTGRAPTSGSLSGFKMICVSEISQADVLSEEAFAKALPDAPAQLTVVPSIPPAVLAAREANAIKKCEERTHQLGPREAGVLGQAVFDALNKTLPCRWHEAHIIVLDEVIISGPAYDKSSTYVPNLSGEQIERLLNEGGESDIAPTVDRAAAKAVTWQRVVKVLEGVRSKLLVSDM
ncbi:hypothetical protein Malapachy_0837 [Malassezia pachydermatis]|uniref:AD domain-containing protein n=1 Tax=Malassezia pachydermatis TaxID=77020 RepID=A0A0M9VPX3_9BASI|nr:hypothetical protein Malapachy_0837 [Malassezia pachydermatis]KOS14915.1 hypothetical protein Malapachy_0837 [Malassezia pachydermatis]